MEAVKGFGRALTGKRGYHPDSNLRGENLQELLRRATAKELPFPDVAVNQQVVDTIQEEVSMGKDTREIVSLLKKRLRTNKPQKQWLAVILLQKVMNDCSNVLGMHTEELLQEVACVMARPAKPETEAGKRARHAAKDLLRSFGRAGTTAFRHANNDMYPRPQMNMIGRFGGLSSFGATYPPAAGLPGPYGGGPPDMPIGARGMNYNAYGNPQFNPGAAMPAPGRQSAAAIERQSLHDEVNLLIDKSRSNVELLSDMLVNSGGHGADEFENDLIKDLMKEVSELRSVFTAYLEELQVMPGHQMEQLMVRALEASDMLDGVVTLQKDVSDNKKLPPEPAAANGSDAQPAQPQQAPAPTPVPAPAPASTAGDLIGLDDDAPPSNAQDPFAPPSTSGPPPMQSPFERMFAAQDPHAAYSAMNVAAAAPYPTEQQLQQQREQVAQQQAAMQETARQAQLTAQQQMELQAQQRQAQEEAQAHARYQQQLLQWQAHQQSLGLSTNPGLNTDMPVLDPITNPFFDPLAEGGLLRAPAAASSGAATYATPPPQPPQTTGAINPFDQPAPAANPAAPIPAAALPAPQQPFQQQPYQQPFQQQPYQQQPQPQATVDAEWDMFFADRSANVQQQQQQQQQQQAATGF